MMDAIEMLKNRRSMRFLTDKPIPKDVIEDILDCARLAPSGNNRQPWHFLVVTDREDLEFLSEKATYGKFIKEGGACIMVFAEKDNKHHLEDGSAATENILLSAFAHGIGTCWVAGYERSYEKDIEDRFGVPEDLRMISIIPMGYPAKEFGKPNKKPLEEVAHWGKFE